MEENSTKKKRGRKPGYHWTEEMKAKSRATWKARNAIFPKRECAAIVSKPEDFGSTPDEDNIGNK